jgi:hypothetical protein
MDFSERTDVKLPASGKAGGGRRERGRDALAGGASVWVPDDVLMEFVAASGWAGRSFLLCCCMLRRPVTAIRDRRLFECDS